MYKYETHLHTSEGSACAENTAVEMVRTCKDRGYDGVFITNHFFNGNTSVDKSLPYKDQVRAFMVGYEKAKEEGEKCGIDVFFGFEYSYLSEGTDLLTYGLGEEFLLEYPDICHMRGDKYIELVHACGGFIVHAHPFRKASYVPMVRLFFDMVDGVEVVNTSNSDPTFNERAMWYAQSYGLPMTGGSDAHVASDGQNNKHGVCGGIEVKNKFETEMDYLTALKGGNLKVIGMK